MSELSPPVSSQDHAQGSHDAPIVLVEYGDYECPYCGEAYPIVKQLQENLGKKLLFAFRNFPLRQAHPHAEHAAETAEFAAANDKFWAMHDLLFENQSSLRDNFLFQLANRLELSEQKLGESLAEHTYRPRVDADFHSGVLSGVNGTPTFFINGIRYNGSFSYNGLTAAMKRVQSAGA